jgi:hypothetical protein
MSASSSWRRSRAWRELKPFLSLVLPLVAYAVLRIVFARVVGTSGFLNPSGSISKGLAVFGFVVLVVRITVLVGVPLILTYRLVQRLLTPPQA